MNERASLLPRFRLLSGRAALGLLFAVLSAVLQLRFGAWYTSVSVFAALFLFLGAVRFHLPDRAQLPVLTLVLLCASFAAFWLTQTALGGSPSLVSKDKALLCMLTAAIVLLFFLLLTARPFWAVCIGLSLLLFLATVDYYVFMFRGSEFLPSDILAVETARGVAAQYDYTPSLKLVRAWLTLLLFLFALSALDLKKLPRPRLSAAAAPLLAGMLAVLLLSSRAYAPNFYMSPGSYDNGFLLNFVLMLKQSFVRAPQDYDPDALKALPADEPGEASAAPTIIAIMNESFADLSVVGSKFRTDQEVMPFIRSLRENTVKGYACSSVFGGTTANSEFEFLTGHSTAFLPSGSVPYQQYVKDGVWSMVSSLKSMGYFCVATSPFFGRGWNIQNVYPAMGFDEMHFLGDYGDAPRIRSEVSDQGMYDYIIRYYEQRDKDKPLFLFGVTMQNHGGYNYDSELYPSVIHLEGYEQSYPEVEQYLTLIHDSDAALANLIEYFSGVDEQVVVVFFGDHFPALPRAFYQETHDAPDDSLDEREKEYMVPYLIWTNYASPAQTPPLTSLNYLGNSVYAAAGLPLPAYNQVLLQYQRVVPVLNSQGYYSADAGRFLPLAEASGEEAAALRQYWQLEYNALFDVKNRLPMFRTNVGQ